MEEAIARFKKLKVSAEYEAKVSPDAVDAGRSARLYSIEVLLKQGDVFYADAQWDKARDKYEEVMAIDPFNVKAMDAIRRINLKLLEAGKRRTGVSRAEYIAETEWKMLTPLVPRISSGPARTQTTEEPIVKDEQKNSIYNKLKNIIIDRIDFDEIEVPVVLRHLRQRSKELDPEKVGVNISSFRRIRTRRRMPSRENVSRIVRPMPDQMRKALSRRKRKLISPPVAGFP